MIYIYIYTTSTWSRIFFHQQYMNSKKPNAQCRCFVLEKLRSWRNLSDKLQRGFMQILRLKYSLCLNFKGLFQKRIMYMTQTHKHNTKWCAKLPPLGGNQGLSTWILKKIIQINRTVNEQRCDVIKSCFFWGEMRIWQNEEDSIKGSIGHISKKLVSP